MDAALRKLFRTVALAALALVCISAAGSEQPSVGNIIRVRPGEHFRGWLSEGGGLGIDGQSYAVFRRHDSLILALTVPVGRHSHGGVEAEKITKIVWVRALTGEDERDAVHCGWEERGRDGSPIIAFYNPRSGVARGYFAAKNRVFIARWLATPDQCPDFSRE
jgi:hypothetical protein